MEFDNDRKRPTTSRTEIACWFFVALLGPLVNWLAVFYYRPLLILLALVFFNLLVLPAYLFYAAVVVPQLLFKKRYAFFVLISAAVYIVVLAVLTGIYSIIAKDNLPVPDRGYFFQSATTILRESLWIFANMVFATAIAFLKASLGDQLVFKEIKKESTVMRLKYLRSQLNPHFLFNTLNSIYSLSLQKSDKTPEVIIKLADIMRYLIYEGAESKVLLSKEIEFIRNYIDIEKTRFTAEVRFTVDGDVEGLLIEPFLFISFIENAFKHAINNSIDGPFIYITIKIRGDEILLTVINNTDIDLETQAKRINGKGITGSKGLLEILYPDSYALNIIQTEKQERKISAIAMKNARERLEILYPDAHTLDVIFNNNVFTVSLLLKLNAQ
jgi:sensor histidine kinase YesM